MHIFALGRYHKVSRCQVVRDPGHFGALSDRSLLHRAVPYYIVSFRTIHLHAIVFIPIPQNLTA